MKASPFLKSIVCAAAFFSSCEKNAKIDNSEYEIIDKLESKLIICEPAVMEYGIADPSNRLLVPLFSDEKWRPEKEIVLTDNQINKILNIINKLPEERAVPLSGYASTAVIIQSKGVPKFIIFNYNAKDYFLISNAIKVLPDGYFSADRIGNTVISSELEPLIIEYVFKQ